jgi:hypothetical protein
VSALSVIFDQVSDSRLGVQCSRDTIGGVLEGRIQTQEAVMTGLVVVDDIGKAFLFSQSFHFSSSGYNEFRSTKADSLGRSASGVSSSSSSSGVGLAPPSAPERLSSIVALAESPLWGMDRELAIALSYVKEAFVAPSFAGDVVWTIRYEDRAGETVVVVVSVDATSGCRVSVGSEEGLSSYQVRARVGDWHREMEM